jgi:hypothetical protein
MTPANHTQALPALLAAVTTVASIVALASRLDWPPPALWHMVVAVGAMPMIFAAMAYFVPVLTRTPDASRRLAAAPVMGMTAGMGAVFWFLTGNIGLRHASPWLGLAAAAGLALWMRRRRRQCLGAAHPCLDWYMAALACLAMGLIAVAVSPLWPEQTSHLRLLHLHVNTLGFMGLTAIGTLQVLLPTVLGKPDPQAHARLVRDLRWSLAGAAGIAVGSAWWWPLTLPAALAYAWPLFRLTWHLGRTYGQSLFARDQPAPLLLTATFGLFALLVHGIAHGQGTAAGRDALPVFLIGFLLPLVSGAVTQLLPVWLRPGAQGNWHRELRRRLAAYARIRAVILLLGGVLAATGHALGYALGTAGAAWLLVGVAWALLKSRQR